LQTKQIQQTNIFCSELYVSSLSLFATLSDEFLVVRIQGAMLIGGAAYWIYILFLFDLKVDICLK